MKIKEVISRDLRNEPQETVRVFEDAQLRTDFAEYVLTEALGREFEKVLANVIESAAPAAPVTNRVGIWVSGFYGSGKSHFAKVAGHVLANTPIADRTSRDRFRDLLRVGAPSHDRLRELLQEANNYSLSAMVVPFDIQTEYAPEHSRNVGITFLRALYRRLGLSSLIPFAERELELKRSGAYDEFVRLFEQETHRSWAEYKHLASSMPDVARCLARVLPSYSAEEYRDALKFEQDAIPGMAITDVTKRLVRWMDAAQADAGGPYRLIFVADEVGNWAGGDGQRIEQVRALVEDLGVLGQGRVWLIATAQEKLSDVVQRVPDIDGGALRNLQQRLEARFQLNVHLESSEVGTVIEERILEKKAGGRPALEGLWRTHEAQLAGIAGPSAVEMGGNYPAPGEENFIRDYPFLPYQIPAAADLFGVMRGPRVSSGARSMIRVVFDAVRTAADDDLGRLISWDRIFNSANSNNEFADERYLGSQGLAYLSSADRDVEGTPLRPSRVLKVLWLVQQNPRISRTTANLSLLLVDHLDADVLRLESDLQATLDVLAHRNFVRLEAVTGQWRFLTQDQVTVERVLQRIADDDVKVADMREEVEKTYSDQLLALFAGRITHGKSNTSFEYGVFYGDTPLKNEDAAVQLHLYLDRWESAKLAAERGLTKLEAATINWVVPVPEKLDQRLRRALAIDRLPSDEELRRVATERTWAEVNELKAEAAELRTDARSDALAALRSGTLYFGGRNVPLGTAHARSSRLPSDAKSLVESAIRDRIDASYDRFYEGDLAFNQANVERLIGAPPADRGALDPDLGFFDLDGRLLPDHPVLEAVTRQLATSTKNSGADLIERFRRPRFGWPPDLIRYALAALFVEGRVVPRDQDGRIRDDPRQRETKALFGTGAFRRARFEIEEQPVTAQERAAAGDLLASLGTPPTDQGEIALKEAILQLAARLLERSQAVIRAREAEVPLPAIYDQVDPLRDELLGQGSRPKLIRALLGQAETLRSIDAALKRLEAFVAHNGPAQYRRAHELLVLIGDAGLAEDPERGAAIESAHSEWDAVVEQRRVLDDWDTRLRDARLQVLENYRGAYLPLRAELASQVQAARADITSMPEYEQLTPSSHAEIRSRFLSEGQPLAEVLVPEVRDEEQLVRASRELSIPHLRARVAALDAQLGAAKAFVLELAAAQRAEGEPAIVVWSPGEVFSGAQFSTEDEVDMVFDDAKDQVKALVRAGKIVRIL